MPVTDPYEVVATALKALIDAEYSVEGYTAIHDHLHESMGIGKTSIGISPLRQDQLTGNAVVGQTWVKVQFYDVWNPEINPTQQVNPFRITNYADRFRRAVQAQQAGTLGSPEVWWFEVVRIEYPHDPTGNKSRFEATICAYGDNPSLIETR
jgi:hypothetical protein